MEEKSELNDIILNKGASTNDNKKVILAIATLGIILIVVILVMNTISSTGTDNLPQVSLESQQSQQPVKTITQSTTQEDPYFEDIEIVEDNDNGADETIEQITQRLKKQSKTEVVTKTKVLQEEKVKTEAKVRTEAKAKAKAKKEIKAKTKTKQKQVQKTTKAYYVQVGSFMKYEPNKKFLKSITNNGFSYRYHKTTRHHKTLNKVLIGPFGSKKEARHALKTIRKSIERGAFIIEI